MERTFLNLDMSAGQFFEYSKEEKPGFVLHEKEDKKTNTVTRTYRKYFRDGVFGYLRALHTHEKTMGKGGQKVTHVRIVLADDEENLTIAEFPMKDVKGQLNSFSVSLFQHVKSLVEGRCYNFFPYAIENEEKTRKNYGTVVRLARLSPSLEYDKVNKLPKTTIGYYKKEADGSSTLVPGEMPPVEWKLGLDDKPAMDTTNRDIALWNLFKSCRINPDFKISVSGGAGTFDSSKEGIAEKPMGSAPAPAPAKAATANTATPATPAAQQQMPKVEHTIATADDDDDEELPF